MHLHTPTGGDHLLVVFVGNLSKGLVPTRFTCTLIHCTGSLYVFYIYSFRQCANIIMLPGFDQQFVDM